MKPTYLAFLIAFGLHGLSSAQAPKKTPVKMILNYYWHGELTPWAYGFEKGFFADEGIDLTFVEDKGSYAAAKSVAADPTARFGYGDLGAMLRAISEDKADLVAIAVFQQQTAAGFAYHADRGFKTMKDVEGHSISVSPGDSMRPMIPVILEKNKIDKSKVKIIQLNPEAKLNSLKTGTVDFLSNYTTVSDGVLQKLSGKDVKWLMWRDYFFDFINSGLYIDRKFLGDKDLNCRFVRAAIRSWNEATAHPEAAIDAIHRISAKINQGDKAVTKRQWAMAMDGQFSKENTKKRTGLILEKDWDNLIEIQTKYAGLKNLPKPKAYYTSEFMDCK